MTGLLQSYRLGVGVLSAFFVFAVPAASAAPVSPEFVEREPEGTASGASAVAEAPGGLHVYATASDGDAVNVYSRDQATGELSFVEAVDGPEPVIAGCGAKNLRSPEDLTISADGKHVYAVGQNAVFVFSRNVATGRLTFVEHELHGCPGDSSSPFLTGASSVAIAPGGEFVYVPGSGTIAIFSRDAVSGALEPSGNYVPGDHLGVPVGALDKSSDIVISPELEDGHVYVSRSTEGPVTVFKRNEDDGSLTFVGEALSGGGPVDRRSSLAMSPDGTDLYVTRYDSDAVAVLERDPVAGTLTLVEQEVNFANGVTDMNRPTAIAISGTSAYVAAEADGAIVRFDRAANGTLSFNSTILDQVGGVDGLSGVSDVLVSGDGDNVYASARSDDVVAAFSRTSPGGAIGFLGADPLDAPNGAAAVAVAPGGQHVYVTGTDYGTLSAYARAADGTLTLLERERQGFDDLTDGGDPVQGMFGAIAVAVSPDGKHVYVAGGFDDAIAIFDREPSTGRLSYSGAVFNSDVDVDGLDGVGGIAVSGDGENVYAAGRVDNSLVVFSRDQISGDLEFLEAEVDGVAGVNALEQPRGVAVHGDHVYVSAYDDNAVSVFERDPAGEVDLTDVEANGSGGVVGLLIPSGITVAPDGESVYVAAGATGASGSVAAFDRHPVTGDLTFAEAEVDGIDDLSDVGGEADGIGGALGLAVVPDGESVLVVSKTSGGGTNFDDSLAVFARDPATSRLSFAEVLDDGIGGVDGLKGASGIALAPGGGHAYASATGDDAVSVFDLVPDVAPPPTPPTDDGGGGGGGGDGAGDGPAPSGDAPPPVDGIAPDCDLSGKPKQPSPKNVKVALLCDEDATMELGGTVKVPKVGRVGRAARKIKIAPMTIEIEAGEKAVAKLKLTGKSKKLVKAAMRRGKTSKATITGRVIDARGNEAALDPLKVRLKAKPKK